MYWCILIDWMSQSAMTLYIYRVGGLVPQEILLQDLNLWKTLVVLGLYLDRQTRRTYRSDRSVPAGQATVPRPVRPLGQTDQIGWCQLKVCLPKNILLSQNCLRAIINTTSAIFCTKGDKQLSAMFCSNRWWNNLFGPPHLLHYRWRLQHGLYLLFHRLLLAHTLQPSLLSMRQAWGTPPWL